MNAPTPGQVPASSDRMADLVEQWELREAIGGVRGMVDSALASTVFLLAYLLDGKRLTPALVAALGATFALLVTRLARREPVRQALGGVVVVAISAATNSGIAASKRSRFELMNAPDGLL